MFKKITHTRIYNPKNKVHVITHKYFEDKLEVSASLRK
jgi:hypothetical protein